jgi:hypothetical protein
VVKREERAAVIEDIYERIRRVERDIDRETVKLYMLAVEQLANEGDNAAKVAWEFLMMRSPAPDVSHRFDPEFKTADVFTWASNVHHNTWGMEGLGGRLKARVVLLRLKGEQ